MSKRVFGRWCLVLSLICLLLTGCSGNLSQEKTLRIATEPAFPPFEFTGQGGNLQGFSIDLMNAIASAANLRVSFQSLPFDGIIPALQSRTVDAAISSITITAERAKTVAFSRPYFKAGLAIAIRSSDEDITGFDSLKNKKIAVQIGTTGAEKAKSIPGAQIRSFDSAPLALQELLNSNVDAVINDAPVTLYAINTGNLQGIKVVEKLLTEEYYGIATAQNSPYLALINDGLNRVLTNGTYSQIYQKWFKAEPPSLPDKSLYENQNNTRKSSSIKLILQFLPTLLQGALVTIQLTILSTLLGLICGTLIALIRLSQFTPARLLARAYVDFFRGTPLLVQIFMIYFGIPALAQQLGFTFNFDRWVAGVIALSVNAAAYIAEIVRAGIQSIEIGQTEAAKSLGLNPWLTMRLVIFPQAFRRMLPPLGNEFISLLKDTSLVAVIGFEELFRKGQLIVADNYRAFEIYAAVAIVYLCLTLLASQVLSRLEMWMNPTMKAQQRKAKR
ncbi:L-arginine ABC transporter membrane protein / L-glutamine ABC transporter membrane protein / L-arginine-binding protein / L-histidine-binding protein / L-histidine ABC transporter membrane protein / L-lysine-binding protein / L-lysine ABC transporter membrane protein / L-glutamine-binding protein [Trichormus variabilis ATCC 29413]|uniref:ABC transmembrane type-1 domain-containing protein n=2 Tax=Anabaena variabilis TaxID=264691 RepID=Q3M695_TRIV2|nr:MULTISPECIES: ABC transporter permease subunit [Nostocaceae]ABA23491.1 L-arginine ABC transporter membrane protein / L-glutamine ABC transporter membrane protein / L-arginine-binding protein / L-histidine-binding protein / L-histidine ABC transporter membrane protein / L-lysine-binding protein / L-lysine ABC transporter membrane protein / L-glutamine-binding protein [Trichormus variabilis ATCC 29413]MBC1216966.1 ABC transporter permease subunit [Trichormus variabilis ARAD]MBC1257633.1 ABC tra